MDKQTITSWRDLTLLQFGALLKDSTADRDHRMYREWFLLVDTLAHADAAYCGQEKERKEPNFKVNAMRTLLAYFFTFAAAVHKRFLFPERDLILEELAAEYGLDLLTQSRRGKSGQFQSALCGMIPDKAVDLANYFMDPSKIGSCLEGVKWAKTTEAERLEQCWEQMLRALEAEDAPAFETRVEDAFAWLEERNRSAYQAVDNENGQHLFDYRTECEMGEAYPRFLRQLDDWNGNCMRLWSAFQKKGRIRLRELSAVLNLTPDETENRGETQHA